MGICTSELLADAESGEGHTYKVTIENAMRGFGRLVVECLKPDSDDCENCQGVDLSAAECRALAKMLNATADLIDENVTVGD